ncbi:MAG: hypothetical protein ACTSXA_03125 [Candidatus Heimdallarchaeota archaeon]
MIKKLRKILPIVILISIGLGVMQVNNQFMVQGVLPVDFYIGETLSWEIEDITTGNIEWWNWTLPFSFEANWHASIGDAVNLTITDSKTINDKNYLEGDLVMGNLSLTTSNYDIGLNLVFSCNFNSWVGGLIALEPNWTALSAQSPFNGSSASIETNLRILYNGLTVEGVRITYDDAFQTSEFFYEQESGILLSADTDVGYFQLSMFLNATSISIPTSNIPGIIGLNFISTIVIGCISLIIIKKKRK